MVMAFIKNLREISNNQKIAGYLFVLPSLLILGTFVIYPLIFSFFSSFFKFNLILTHFTFVGIQNYIRVLHDSRFVNSLINTGYYSFVEVPLQIVISLLIALAIKSNRKYNLFLRSIFFLPVICSTTAVSLVMVFLLNKDLGAIANYLRFFGIQSVDWLRSTTWAMPTVILISVWKNFGLSMIIFLAGLQSVPDFYYEAAELDGAGRVAKFFRITLPMIMPTAGFITITTLITSFQVFDQVFVMTNGGPLFKTETMVQYIYYKGFVDSDIGFATANAFILFIIILLATLIMFQFMKRNERHFE
jgi:multiple sugar transport system permease protein